MATVVFDVKNPIELRKAGMKALTNALGYDATKAFLSQAFGGSGDWTQERHELPELGFEKLTEELEKFDEEAFLRKYGGEAADDFIKRQHERKRTGTAAVLL